MALRIRNLVPQADFLDPTKNRIFSAYINKRDQVHRIIYVSPDGHESIIYENGADGMFFVKDNAWTEANPIWNIFETKDGEIFTQKQD